MHKMSKIDRGKWNIEKETGKQASGRFSESETEILPRMDDYFIDWILVFRIRVRAGHDKFPNQKFAVFIGTLQLNFHLYFQSEF